MNESDANPILFFDGVCGLCNSVVDFVLQHDRRGIVRFAPLQGTTSQELLPDHDRDSLDTVVFIEGSTLTRRSTAIVRLLSHLGGFWTIVAWLLWLIPWPLRDVGYRVVSKLRYRLFGRKETCRMPSPDERARFLD
ncbi:MAG: thiol-disulfide oxidoreductase DCC family protein [Planctomycetota bacterium]